MERHRLNFEELLRLTDEFYDKYDRIPSYGEIMRLKEIEHMEREVG